MGRTRGIFIAIEGIDAVGKRTQTSLLMTWLKSRGMTARTFSFPMYETTIGKEIKKFLAGSATYPPQVRAMLYSANRWETKPEIEAALSKTDAIIVDRYSGSNLAYGVSSNLDLQWLLNLEAGLPEPDLTLLLDAPLAKVKPRRRCNRDSYERNTALQERAKRAYEKLAARFGWTVIDADRGAEETGKAIASAVSIALGRRRSDI